MPVTMATSPAVSGQPNEDYAIATDGLYVVADGAGIPLGSDSGCSHSVAWFARRLGTQVFHHAALSDVSLSDALAASISDVAKQHEHTCDLQHPGTPSSTMTVARIRDGRLEYLVLADSPLIVRHHHGVEVINDDRGWRLGSQYRQRLETLAAGSREHTETLRTYVETMRQHRNRHDGFWVASVDPEAAHQATTGTFEISEIQEFALLSDGASRIVDRFHHLTWGKALDVVRDHGPSALIQAVRTAEALDPEGLTWPRGKSSDDASVIYIKLS